MAPLRTNPRQGPLGLWVEPLEAGQMPLEASEYLLARLRHLEEVQPRLLLELLEQGRLLDHLRLTANRALAAEVRLREQGRPPDLAAEQALAQVVAPNRELLEVEQLEEREQRNLAARLAAFRQALEQQVAAGQDLTYPMPLAIMSSPPATSSPPPPQANVAQMYDPLNESRPTSLPR